MAGRGDDMAIETVVKEGFSVLGKEGRGPASQGPDWIRPLWRAADADFAQIRDKIRYRADGAPLGMWGAMSDIHRRFARWGAEGLYLAGCECAPGTAPPDGWVRWDIPAFRYLVARDVAPRYDETFAYILQTYIPQNGHNLAGAVHEGYPQPGNAAKIDLYFPIERLYASRAAAGDAG